jgi:hypothetical protein
MPSFVHAASVAEFRRQTLAPDDQRERRSRPLLLDETGSLRRAARPAAHCRLGRAPVVMPNELRAFAIVDESERESIVARDVRGSSGASARPARAQRPLVAQMQERCATPHSWASGARLMSETVATV